MPTIYLMRHGESVVNIERRLTCRTYDGDLTERGREQARRAGEWLRDKGIRQILHSPFHRARQTADIVGEIVGLTPVADADLCEMDCGELDGKTSDEAWEVWGGVYRRWLMHDLDAAFPGGESYRQARERLTRALAKAVLNEAALLVTHGGIITTVVPTLCVNAAALQDVQSVENTGCVVLETYDADRYSCVAWNLIDHFA